MSDFTYEYGKKNGTYEKYEWDNTWVNYANKPERTRVLYIGDSISYGVRNVATPKTNDEILFDGFATSRGIDNEYLIPSISLFAKLQQRRDAVVFNNGLHGWHLDDETEYAEYYENVVKFLVEEFKGTPIFILSSTHVKDEENDKRVVARNKVAAEIANKYNIPYIDIYTIALNNKELLSDGVHFEKEGYELFADEIIGAVKTVIK